MAIYNEDYYRGIGADPLIHYVHELEAPETTIRNFEWKGIHSMFQHLLPAGGRWLDYGCGTGGLVAFGKKLGLDIVGFDEGWGAQAGRNKSIPILTLEELLKKENPFDFISAIEVIEHAIEPLPLFRRIRSLLKPGGIFFFTTGNAQPWRRNLMDWPYTSSPEVHVSFFEPNTLRYALQISGFQPKVNSYTPGWTDILKYKILKNLRIKNRHSVIDRAPWRLLTSLVDSRYQLSKIPLGIAAHHV